MALGSQARAFSLPIRCHTNVTMKVTTLLPQICYDLVKPRTYQALKRTNKMESLKTRKAQIQWTEEDRRNMVIAVQTSKSLPAVAQKLHMDESEVKQKIAYLRRNGVKLRKFKQPKPDFTYLQKLARQYDSKEFTEAHSELELENSVR